MKSIGVIVGTILIIVIIGIICCCQNRYIEKKLRQLERGRRKVEKSTEELLLQRKIGEVLGM
jgi:hypothetical protein